MSRTYTIAPDDFKRLSAGSDGGRITVKKRIPAGTCEIAVPGKSPIKCRVKAADIPGYVVLEKC